MANTKIQIKRSSITATPAGSSLSAAEPAYSYSSNTLFIGGSDGVGVLPIGGKFYIDQQAIIFDKANSANVLAFNTGIGANAWANTVATAGNNYAVTIGASGNNYANLVAAAANAWANTVATAGNNYTNSVGAAGNNYTNVVGAASNTWANTVGTAGNNYTNAVGTAGNNYTNAVGDAGNNYTVAVGAASNNYSNATFVKLISTTTQTITGDIAITGNLTFLGNATTISSNNLIVGDSLIYLAANNYSGTDLLDIGFIANYGNTTGANVHTGLIRDATTKQYYLFQGYDEELTGNNATFTMGANNSSYATLNADIIAGNLSVSGTNVYPWIVAAFTAANSSNGWANTVATAGNNYTNSVGAAGNNYTNAVGTAGNNYTNAVGAASNNWANTVATAGNNYTNSVGTAGNNYTNAVGAAGNNYTNAVGTAGNNYTIFVGASGNNWTNSVAASANAWSLQWANNKIANVAQTSGRTVVTFTNTNGHINATVDLAVTGITATTYGGNATIPYVTVDDYGRVTAAGNTGINVSAITTGTLPVAYGGTGNTTFTANGVLFGNGTSPVQVTAAGTDGQVLQVAGGGVPSFGMLDGGTFIYNYL